MNKSNHILCTSALALSACATTGENPNQEAPKPKSPQTVLDVQWLADACLWQEVKLSNWATGVWFSDGKNQYTISDTSGWNGEANDTDIIGKMNCNGTETFVAGDVEEIAILTDAQHISNAKGYFK